MAEPKHIAGLDGSQSVSALGLRWAALRGMLASPLIMTEDQSALKEELLRELRSIEQDFASLQSRNLMEVSAKIDVAKTAMKEGGQTGQGWIVGLLDSIQNDLHSATARNAGTHPHQQRPVSNLPRSYPPRTETEAGGSSGESESSTAA